MSRLLYKRTFGAFGDGTVIVRPHALRRPQQIFIGSGGAIFEDVWLQCENDDSRITIGDRANFARCVAISSTDPVTLGDDCLMGFGSLITSGDHDRVDRHLTGATGPVTIGDSVFIGQGAIVLGGVTIGDGASIGANAVVTRDVAAGDTVVGIPARSTRT
ncbi:DapH/DapD/GlmU-related protein [Nocardioides sp. SYSU D00065]|uniref:acyltransferase n=1 Tax=Nocardioides sp. SYSU D00065 TaxID=2817378 RepID=UPI001B320294|nr:acyltransferase [Nocardioides sp. SYSU D00065]